RPGDEDEVVPAAHHVADRDRVEDAVPGSALLGHAFVGARDGNQLLDARQLRDLALRELRDVAVHADQRDLLTLELAGLEPEVVELTLDGGDLVGRRVAAHLDEHARMQSNPARGVKCGFTAASDLLYEPGAHGPWGDASARSDPGRRHHRR